MASDIKNTLPTRHRRRLRNRVNIPKQPLPIAPFAWSNGWQVCTTAPTQQVNQSPADLLSYAFEKAVLAFASFGLDEFIKDLRTPRRGETALDRLGKELFIAAFLEPGRNTLADARKLTVLRE